MTFYLVPHQPRADKITIWVGWWKYWSRLLPKLDLVLEEAHPQQRVVELDDSWQVIGRGGSDMLGATELRRWTNLRWRTVDFDGLASDRHYTVRLLTRPGGHELTRCSFDTLPTELPLERLGTIESHGAGSAADETLTSPRPLTVFLGSCYWAQEDLDRTVSMHYGNVYRSEEHRPHVKFLVGDQVYVDQPPAGEWAVRKSTNKLRSFLTGRYALHWERLQGLLERGANICIADDHEFWNDCPYNPLFIWNALQRKSYRDTVKQEAGNLFKAVQLGQTVTTFDIGGDLSFFVADTRVNRDDKGHEFMHPEDFELLRGWIENLKMPGVLVLGQPLFQPALSYATKWDLATWAGLSSPIGDIVTDHNLGAFDQYAALSAALTGSLHDILVLSGDVHFGRIGRVTIHRRDGDDPVRIWEVISSPLSLLGGAGAMPTYHPAWFPGPPGGHEIGRILDHGAQPHLHEEAMAPGRIRYVRDVSSIPMEWVSHEHFMTLRFLKRADARGVIVDVSAWLIDEPPNPRSGLPIRDWTYTFELDGARLVPGKKEQRVVTHTIRGRRGETLALANPSQAWSPRWKHEAIRDIRDGRASYLTNAVGAGEQEVRVVDGPDGPYLRTNPDERSPNNLDALPQPPSSHFYD